MNAGAYLMAVAASLLLAMGLYALMLGKNGLPKWIAAIALPLSAVLSFVLGKGLYVLLQLDYVWPRWGWASLLKMDPTQFSFLGGVIGALLGVFLAGEIGKAPRKKNLDVFAPSLALLFGLWKFAEYFLGDYASGAYVENEGLQFFPLAVMNQYEEWYFAIFMLAGALALGVFVICLLRGSKTEKAGLLFLRTAFYLMLPLVICESLRSECMKWGFVKCEMLLYGLLLFLILLLHCRAGEKKGFGRWTIVLMTALAVIGVVAFETILTAFSWYGKVRWIVLAAYLAVVAGMYFCGRWAPLVTAALLMVGVVGVEVMLDKLSWPKIWGYSFMIALLLGLAALERFTVRHRIEKE